MSTEYGARFYETIRPGVQRSAAVLVPLLMARCSIDESASVIDVGCGEGWWLEEFAERGCDVLGIDGAHVEPRVPYLMRDLSREGVKVAESFDVALCLEVAEHLPIERAPSLVAELCKLAPVVIFSAAIPGQTGAGHVNCQWPSWWADHFDRYGFHVSGALRFHVWNDVEIEPWYRQNLLVAMRHEQRFAHPDLFTGPASAPLPLVHPDVWAWKQ